VIERSPGGMEAEMQDNPLARLKDFGQSVWCDDIGRELLNTGGLEALIQRDGVCGLTSNPTIFYKAITGGSAYDEEIDRLVSAGASAGETLESLMFADIGLAASQLLPVYDATASKDGWVSIEVAPSLAYDTQGTVTEVKRVRALIDHPNVLVKVPGTEEGVAAIRDLVGLGYSINVTLIFSVERYGEVIEAYLAGLETLQARRDSGEPVPAVGDVHGVASFFVSRLDTNVDRRLDALAAQASAAGKSPEQLEALRGKTAVANAKAAYRLFQESFTGPRWETLRAKGANSQRPLWASTGTKDKKYSDILYVQELIGADTVNTMPLATMDAYRDHGEPAETVTKEVDEALEHLDALEAAGISLAEVTAQLEIDGVKAFFDSYEALLTALEAKRPSGLGSVSNG
jgi:transaldolase